MGFYINFCTNVMSGLTLLCADLRFGLSPASSPLQSPFRSSFSLLLDFLTSPLLLKVQSSAISRPFWTSSCLLSTSRSNPPLFLTPFGLPRISPPLQSPFRSSFSPLLDFLLTPPLQGPILRSFSLLLDFRVPPLCLKVQSATFPLPTTQKRRIAKQSASLIPAILIRQSNSTISMPLISQFHQVKHLQ